GSLADAGRQDAAEVDLLDVGGSESGALDGAGERAGAEPGGRHVAKGPLERADRGARGAQDDDVGHRDFLRGLPPARAPARMPDTGRRNPAMLPRRPGPERP